MGVSIQQNYFPDRITVTLFVIIFFFFFSLYTTTTVYNNRSIFYMITYNTIFRKKYSLKKKITQKQFIHWRTALSVKLKKTFSESVIRPLKRR